MKGRGRDGHSTPFAVESAGLAALQWDALAIVFVKLILLIIVAAISISVLVVVVVVTLLSAATVVDELLALEHGRQLFGNGALLLSRGECLGKCFPLTL